MSNLRASLDRVLASRRPHSMPVQKYDISRPDGGFEERWWDPVNSPVLDASGEVEALVHHVSDITEQRRAEAALRASEATLRELNADLERKVTERALARGRTWQVSPEIMGVLNADGHFEESNPAWASVLGWSAEEVARTVFFDFIHPYDLTKTRAAWADAIEREAPALRFENRYRQKNGGWRWLSWVAVPDDGKVYCSARDITVEKEQAADLADRTAERDRMWETSPDLMLVIDFDGVFRRVNPAWTRTLGYCADELVGRHVNEFVLTEDHGETINAYKLAASGGLPIVENRYLHKDESVRWISWTAAPAGDLTYATGRDITQEKDRDAELRTAQEALRQSQKMEAMGQLTGGVAHDFNNLLTPIVGSLDMLQRKDLGGEREKRLIAGAMQSAERAKVLVQRLLAFARRQPLQPAAIDIAKLVTDMADLVSSTTGPQIKVVVDATNDLPPAQGDANQLEMALLNLSVNARDAMPEGGTLRISATPETVRAGQVTGLKPGGYVKLSVADTGVGMDEATLARAVEPFFSTKGVGKGTGLGLSMVHGLASQLGGALCIRSQPGLGTNIELWLSQSAAAPETDQAPAALVSPRISRGRALLVDDEAIIRLSTADMLDDLGYEVVEAGSAEEALGLVERGLLLDILVTDHLMPGMSGSDLARILQARSPQLPILIVSGYAEGQDIALDLKRLTKPFRCDELAASLASLSGHG